MVLHVNSGQIAVMLKTTELTGLWTRSLMAWPDGRRDTTTVAGWLQGQASYADLRQPPDHAAQLAHVHCLDDLTIADCRVLAAQKAFAGVFMSRGEGVFEWVRMADYQPPRPGKDVGRLFWEGDILVEEGLQGEYFEYWHRDPALPATPRAALMMQSEADGRFGLLLRVANMFMFVRDRLIFVTGTTLAAVVEAAPSLAMARELVDFEISFGEITAGGWRIARSTLPFREDSLLRYGRTGDGRLRTGETAPDGTAAARDWIIMATEGDTSIFPDRNHEIL